LLIIIVDAPGAGPILASHMGVDWSETLNIMGRHEDVANRSDVVRLTVIVDTGGQKDFVFIPNCYAFVGNAKALVVGDFKNWPVLPANGGTKKVKFTVNDKNVNVKTTNSANTVGVTMALTALNGGTISAPDQNGYITLQAGKEYEMTLTSAQKAAGDNWAVDNINVEFTDGVNAPENYKFTVFWVVLSSPDNCHVTGQNLPGAPENPLNSKASAKGSGIFDMRKLRDASASMNWGSRNAGRVLTDYNQGEGRSSTVILVRGRIVPSNMKTENFFSVTDPKSDPQNNTKRGFSFRRNRWTRAYFERGDKTYFADYPVPTANMVVPAGPITYSINSDNVNDTWINNIASDLHPDADGDAGELYIYDFDSPSLEYTFVPCVGDVLRMRSNFTQWVEYGQGRRCSDDFQWTSAQSIKRTAANAVVGDDQFNADGDNVITVNSTIHLTRDLKQGNTDVPFHIDSLSHNEVDLQDKRGTEFEVRADTPFPDAQPEVTALKTSAASPDLDITDEAFTDEHRRVMKAEIVFESASQYFVAIKFAGVGAEVVYIGDRLRGIGEFASFGRGQIAADTLNPGRWIVLFYGIDEAGNPLRKKLDNMPVISEQSSAVSIVSDVDWRVDPEGRLYYGCVFLVNQTGIVVFHCAMGSKHGDSPPFIIDAGSP